MDKPTKPRPACGAFDHIIYALIWTAMAAAVIRVLIAGYYQ